MDMMLAGFIALGVLIIGQFAWLRRDILELRKHMGSKIEEFRKDMSTLRSAPESKIDSRTDSPRSDLGSKIDSLDRKIGELSERVARIEGFLKGVFMRRDLTPFPEPSPSGGRPDKPGAA